MKSFRLCCDQYYHKSERFLAPEHCVRLIVRLECWASVKHIYNVFMKLVTMYHHGPIICMSPLRDAHICPDVVFLG